MILHAIIAIGTLVGIFVLFLVLSRTLGNIINHMTKLELLLNKELELCDSELVVKEKAEVQMRKANRYRHGDEEEQAA